MQSSPTVHDPFAELPVPGVKFLHRTSRVMFNLAGGRWTILLAGTVYKCLKVGSKISMFPPVVVSRCCNSTVAAAAVFAVASSPDGKDSEFSLTLLLWKG